MNTYQSDFPLLHRKVGDKPLVYFDNAATSPKPQSVIDAISNHYKTSAGNPGRGIHSLSRAALQVLSDGRQAVLQYLSAQLNYSVVFTKNTTDSINMVAFAYGQRYRDSATKPAIITTVAEHHSNFLPWLRLHKENGFPLFIVPLREDRSIDLDKLEEIANQNKGGLLAIALCSNVTGIITDLKHVSEIAAKNRLILLVDAAQAFSHFQINLSETPVDYLVASAHKAFGPEGVGVLVLRQDFLKILEPESVGGGMVDKATTTDYVWKTTEERLEAGTGNTAGVAGLTTALSYISNIGFNTISSLEQKLTEHFIQKAQKFDEAEWIAPLKTEGRLPLFTFNLPGIHPHDVADFLDEQGIAVRAGHHCAQPLHQVLGLTASVRASLSFVNTTSEIDYFFEQLLACRKRFA